MELNLPTCQCEVRLALAILYDEQRRAMLQAAFDSFGRDARWHMWFEEEYIFPHLPHADQAKLLHEHAVIRAMMDHGDVTGASTTMMTHAIGESKIFNTMRR